MQIKTIWFSSIVGILTGQVVPSLVDGAPTSWSGKQLSYVTTYQLERPIPNGNYDANRLCQVAMDGESIEEKKAGRFIYTCSTFDNNMPWCGSPCIYDKKQDTLAIYDTTSAKYIPEIGMLWHSLITTSDLLQEYNYKICDVKFDSNVRVHDTSGIGYTRRYAISKSNELVYYDFTTKASFQSLHSSYLRIYLIGKGDASYSKENLDLMLFLYGTCKEGGVYVLRNSKISNLELMTQRKNGIYFIGKDLFEGVTIDLLGRKFKITSTNQTLQGNGAGNKQK